MGTRVVRCACGLVCVTPQPPRSSLEQAYDQAYYRPWEDQARLRQIMWRRRMDHVAALVPPPAMLLDVGCGTGTFLRLARMRGCQVAGTELSHAGAEAARAQGLHVHLARGRLPRLYEPDEREVHLFHFSAHSLRALFASAKFDVVEVGFDRGAVAVWGKRLVNEVAYAWFCLTGLNWGMGLELIARKPEGSRP